MELDFKSVQALSSPTRIRILREVLESESTTTDLSRDLEKSKSTISSHLDILVKAGLVEKDSEEGRKRVIYRPTSKAEAIVLEKERKVKFSLISTAFSALLGFGSIWHAGNMLLSFQAASVNDNAMMAQDLGAEATRTGIETGLSPEIFLFAGAGFLAISLGIFLYGLMIRKLTQ